MQDAFLIKLKSFADLIVKPIVSYPNEINISCERKETHVRVFISDQARCDQGKLCGRGQQTLWSLRCLMQSFAAKYGERVEVQIMEPIKDMPEIQIGEDPLWNEQKSKDLAGFTMDILERIIRDYTGEVAAHDADGITRIMVKTNDITPVTATALGRIVKLAGRMRGRKTMFQVGKVAT